MRILQDGLNDLPDDPHLNANLGLCHARRNEFGAAQTLYKTAYDAFAGSPENEEAFPNESTTTALALAWCSQRLMHFENAIQLYQGIYQKLPEKHEVLGLMAEAYRDLGRSSSAIATLEYLIQQCPESFEARWKLAGLHEGCGEMENAVHV